MHNAREPHPGTARGIGRENQENQQLPNTSQEISAISRNGMLSLSPWAVVYHLFWHDQHRLMLVSRYWLEECKKSFTGVSFFLKISAVLLTKDDGQAVWFGHRHSLPPQKSAFWKDGLTKCLPVSKTAHVSWVPSEERRQSHILTRVMSILPAPQKYQPLIWPELLCELKLSEMI